MISKKEVCEWKENGFAVVKNLIPISIVLKCQHYVKTLYDKNELNVSDFGSRGKLEFPSFSIIDMLTTNENIIKSVQRLLQTDDIILTQSDTWGKIGKDDYSNESNNDQRMHMDYGNNTFLHPPEWKHPECVSIIIYLSDTKYTGGGTCCVPRKKETEKFYTMPYTNMPGIGKFPFINDRKKAEEFFKENDIDTYNFRQDLYKNEMLVNASSGDVLFYRMDVWHRGTPVFPGKIRFVTNLVFKRRDCFWIHQWNTGWTRKMYYGHLERMIEQMTPLQRSIFGIPLPGNGFWTKEKIYHFQSRYPNVDITPYQKYLQTLST